MGLCRRGEVGLLGEGLNSPVVPTFVDGDSAKVKPTFIYTYAERTVLKVEDLLQKGSKKYLMGGGEIMV